MTTALNHLGLSQTGAASLQIACAKGSEARVEQGVLYPWDEYLTCGAIQHQALAVGVGSESIGWIDQTVRRLRQTAEGHPILLISSEHFVALLHDPETFDRMHAFRNAFNREFERLTEWIDVQLGAALQAYPGPLTATAT